MQIRFKAPPLLTNFLGLDLKLGKLFPAQSSKLKRANNLHSLEGVSIVTLFGVLNKVAGVYGMLAVLTGGTLAQPISQLTMYIYSIATLVVFLWGLKKISEVRSSCALLSLRSVSLTLRRFTGEWSQDPHLRASLRFRPFRRHHLHRHLRRHVVRSHAS